VSHPNGRLILAVLVTLLAASTASAQRRAAARAPAQDGPTIGFQAGFPTNNLDFFVGGQVSIPLAPQWDFYPSLDFFFPGSGTTVWAINGEARYWPKLAMVNPGLYVGGGVDITHVSVSGFGSDTQAGPAIVGGWDFKAVSWRPFLQIHIVFGNDDRVEFGGGVNFRL